MVGRFFKMKNTLKSRALERYDTQRKSDLELVKSYLTPEFAEWCVSHYVNTSDGTNDSDSFLMYERLFDFKYGSSMKDYDSRMKFKKDLQDAWLAKDYGTQQRKELYQIINAYLKPHGIRLSTRSGYEFTFNWETIELIPSRIDTIKSVITSELVVLTLIIIALMIISIIIC